MRRVVLLLACFVGAAGCSGTGSAPATPTAPSVAPTSSSIAISNLSVRRAGTGKDCGIDEQLFVTPIDEVAFDFSNPTRMDLTTLRIQRTDVTGGSWPIGRCQPDMCRPGLEGNGSPDREMACLVSGDETAASGRLVMHRRYNLRPTESYQVVLQQNDTRTPVSNSLEGAVVNLPDASNSRPAIISLIAYAEREPFRLGQPLYFPTLRVQFYKPSLRQSTAGAGLESEVSFYTASGRMFSFYRRTEMSDFSCCNWSFLHADGITTLSPPIRAVLRLRQTAAPEGRSAVVQRCDDDAPDVYVNFKPCRFNPVPPSTATVLWETTRDVLITMIRDNPSYLDAPRLGLRAPGE